MSFFFFLLQWCNAPSPFFFLLSHLRRGENPAGCPDPWATVINASCRPWWVTGSSVVFRPRNFISIVVRLTEVCKILSLVKYLTSYSRLKPHLFIILSSCLFVANYSPDRLEEFIDVINTNLQPMFMQIRKGMSEDDGAQYYALVRDIFSSVRLCCEITRCIYLELIFYFFMQINMAETDITRMSSDYADNELELFRKTVNPFA